MWNDKTKRKSEAEMTTTARSCLTTRFTVTRWITMDASLLIGCCWSISHRRSLWISCIPRDLLTCRSLPPIFYLSFVIGWSIWNKVTSPIFYTLLSYIEISSSRIQNTFIVILNQWEDVKCLFLRNDRDSFSVQMQTGKKSSNFFRYKREL